MIDKCRVVLPSTFVAATLLFVVGGVQAQTAEDASAACLEAARMIEEKDFAGALDEAKWCVESLEQIKQERTLTVFPEEVNGYSGGDIQNESAMGMSMIEREYSLDGKSIKVALTSGMAGGGLAALAQLGMGMGGSGKKIRVQKRTVIDMSESSGDAQYLVQLKSSKGMLMISSDDVSSDDVLDFVRVFPIKELDEALEP